MLLQKKWHWTDIMVSITWMICLQEILMKKQVKYMWKIIPNLSEFFILWSLSLRAQSLWLYHFTIIWVCCDEKLHSDFLTLSAPGYFCLIMSRGAHFWKIMQKIVKICFFSKINLVAARKKIFKIFYQLLKVKITCKLNIHRLVC